MTFYFYDLETSGVDPKTARIMQFAGQRTDEQLRPIGEPDDFLIKLHPDILPEPDAILLTGITPQRANAEGLSEPEFLRFFTEEIATPDTIFLGFNTIRFDDEFMRYLHFRNYYDPYVWQWKDGRSRWDMLDVVRMMRALRPEGLQWPVASDGSATNRLESLTKVNNIEHLGAHTALADVQALVSLTQKVHSAQPKLFTYLLGMRSKQAVRSLVSQPEPFIYTSGSLDSQYEKTTIAYCCTELPDQTGCVIYDTRYSIDRWQKMSIRDLQEAYAWQPEKPPADYPPFKILQYNRCPAVAPLSVLDSTSQERLSLDPASSARCIAQLRKQPTLVERITEVLIERKKQPTQTQLLTSESNPDTRLYDGFIPKADEPRMQEVRQLQPAELKSYQPDFQDKRLQALWPLYKARTYPKLLSPDERRAWEKHIEHSLYKGAEKSPYALFVGRLQELAMRSGLTKNDQYVLGELKLYAESFAPY